MKIPANALLIGGGLLAVVGVAYLFFSKKGAALGVGQAVGSAAVDLASGAASGVVYGIGDAIGVPRTDETECQKALREGRHWDASFACPATTFIGSLF